MIYMLTETEQQTIRDMATKIENQGRLYFNNNYKIDKSMRFFDMNLNGFGAELAFCKLFKTEFDSTTNQYENHFNKNDTVLNTGESVDVKTTKYKNGRLLVRLGKENKKVDLYSLMIGEFPKFEFKGFAKYNDIIDSRNIIEIKGVPTYALTQEQLTLRIKTNTH